MQTTFPSGTSEFYPVPIMGDGVTITTGVSYSIVPAQAGPGAWTAATVMNNETGFMVSGFAVGMWRIWAKVVTGSETPVIDCGTFLIV